MFMHRPNAMILICNHFLRFAIAEQLRERWKMQMQWEKIES